MADTAEIIKPLPQNKSYSTTEEPYKEPFDEVTYQHDMYKGIGVDNPCLAYVWTVVPSSLGEIEDVAELMKKLASQSDEALMDEEDLYDEAQNFISFTIERSQWGLGRFTMQLYDNKYTEIESKLLQNKGIIAFKYGYTAAPENGSPWHIGFVTNYSIKFQLEGTYITIQGISNGWASNVVQRPIAYNDVNGKIEENMTISDLVIKVAKDYLNFTDENLIVEPTSPLTARGSGLKNNDKTSITINNIPNNTTFDYFSRELARRATNTNGQGGYCFYIETIKPPKGSDTKQRTILHFHTLNYKKDASEPTKLFTLFKDENTVVRSFTPDWGVAVMQARGGGKVSSIAFDPINKTVIRGTITIGKDPIDVTEGTRSVVIAGVNGTEESTSSLPITSQNQEVLTSQLAAYMNPRALQAQKATLEIQGTTDIKVLDTIAVHVYIPKGNMKYSPTTGEQQVHWISGDFRVLKITDSLSKGDFQTTLDLCFSGRELGGGTVKIGKSAR